MKIKNMNLLNKLGCFACACSMLALFACSSSSDGDGGDGDGSASTTGDFFLAITGTDTEYIILTDDLEQGSLKTSDNVFELEMTDYLWTFHEGVAVGLVYMQESPGIGYAFNLTASKTLNRISKFTIDTRFTSYGFFENYLITSVGGETPAGTDRVDAAIFVLRNTTNFGINMQQNILTQEITGDDEIITFSGIVDRGNGEFLTGVVKSEYLETSSSTGGSSTGTVSNPDICMVAAFDADLNLKRMYSDTRLSYSSGRYRSQYYSQMGKADDGTVYVFSGSYESSTIRPCGALRIKADADTFDEEYYFNIQALSNNYKFKRVWHISGNRFLLEMYNDTTPTAVSPATQYAIVDVVDQTFTWVSNLPSKSTITYSGIPLAHNGKVYLAITEYGVGSSVYVVDPATGEAVKGVTISGATEIRAIGYLGK